MKETIDLIEKQLQENKEVLRRLDNEQDKLISALADNHSNKHNLLNTSMRLERQLKDIYDQHNDINQEINKNFIRMGEVQLKDCDLKEKKKSY